MLHGTPIMTLLNRGGPAAVIWRVRSIVVDAIQLIPRWLRSHVCQEGGKVVAPSITHRDATTTPISIARMMRVVAARLRVAPGVVFGRSGLACFVSMLERSLASAFVSQATTTHLRPSLQVLREYQPGLSAVAAAQPESSRVRWHAMQDGQPSESEAAKIN